MRDAAMVCLGILVGAMWVGQTAHADPAPAKSVCTRTLSDGARVSEFMNNNIAAGRVRFLGTGDVVCAW